MSEQKIAYSGPSVKALAATAPVLALYGSPAPGRCACPDAQRGKGCSKSAGKHPNSVVMGVNKGQGLKVAERWNATQKPEVIDEWIKRAGSSPLNWALVTGKAIPKTEGEWLIVLDVDPRNNGDETLGQYEAQYGELPHTWTVLTGGGGQHYYFRVKTPSAPMTVTTLRGIEIKADGGYVVIPPSMHMSGTPYRWDLAVPVQPSTLAYAPSWVVDILCGTGVGVARKVKPGSPTADPAKTLVGEAMQAAGMTLGTWVGSGTRPIECPWANEHTGDTGRGEDSSSALLVPTLESPRFGGWRCQHAHCNHRGIRDLLTKLPVFAWEKAAERYPKVLRREHRELLGFPPDDLLPVELLAVESDAGTDDDDDFTADPPPLPPAPDNEDAALAGPRRPRIRLGPDRSRVCQELRSALGGAHLVFCQGEALVAIRDQSLMVCKPGTIQELIDDVADIEAYNKTSRSWEQCALPKELCTTILEGSKVKGFLPLKGLARLPYVGPSGSLVTEPGYNPDSSYFLLDSEDLRKVELPLELTQRAALSAIQVLRDMTCDIPFASDVHGYGWIALLLTMIARPTIDGCTPLFAFDASAPGSGKTILVRSAAQIAFGQEYLCSAGIANQAEEMRKAITSSVAAGSPIMLLDNFTGTLRSPPLEAALTTRQWVDRILTTSSSISAPMQMIFAITGNNLKLGNDIPRRAFICRLEPEMSIHERGEFRHGELDVFAKNHRFELYTAALTILAAHAVAGCPDGHVKPRPGFENWSRKVASAIAWAGGPDVTPLFADAEGADDSITEEEFAREIVVDVLERMYPEGAEFTARQLYDRLWGELNQRAQWIELVDALDVLREGRDDRPWTPQKVGEVFGKMKDRPVTGRRLLRRKTSGNWLWRVTRLPQNHAE